VRPFEQGELQGGEDQKKTGMLPPMCPDQYAKDTRRYTKYNAQNDRINEYSESNRYAFIGGCGAEAYRVELANWDSLAVVLVAHRVAMEAVIPSHVVKVVPPGLWAMPRTSHRTVH